MMTVFQKRRTFFVFLLVFITLIVLTATIFVMKGGRNIDIVGSASGNSLNREPMSMLRGEECEGGNLRP